MHIDANIDTFAGIREAWLCHVAFLIRLWKQGIRDLVMERCCALHNFRVRLAPWQPVF
jgi:hypothetical protein